MKALNDEAAVKRTNGDASEKKAPNHEFGIELKPRRSVKKVAAEARLSILRPPPPGWPGQARP